MTDLAEHQTRRPSQPAPLSAAAAALVLSGPLLVLVSELIAPREPGDATADEYLDFLLGHQDRLTLGWLTGLLASAALAAGYVVVASRFTDRGRVVGRIAAALGVLGAIGLAGHCAVSLAAMDLAQDGGTAAAIDVLSDNTAAFATILPVIIGLNLGILLLSVAIARAGWAPRWVIVLGVLALLSDFLVSGYNTVLHAVFATAVLGLAVRGLRSPREHVAPEPARRS